ncbi:pentapeptide repeat-containing protein [Rhodococcus marinonascens]|uniref:pentapeptide repeat-containing protein n=1 Tax=Rhodococcus marinonascens TaxID=38311 RepID=UPI00093330B2|nr:pentapeptide repeat-containing protein [Rhodococcus marinonascens]
MTATRAASDLDALRPDCGSCFALCCTAFGFSRSEDFAIDKPAGSACRNLETDFSCGIHEGLRARGFRGCTVFDCFGAGQAVSQRVFSGVSWSERPETQREMFSAFKIMRQLHEMLWYLAEARTRTFDPDAADEARKLTSAIYALTGGNLDALLSADTGALHSAVRRTLMDISEELRASYGASGGHLDRNLKPGADLIGQNLRSRSLCGADLRGAYLIAADLRRSDLTAVDLLGADLRDARVDGADLSEALYVTQSQINAARGSADTRVPQRILVPPHWRGQ